MVNNVPVTSSGDRREYSDPAAPELGMPFLHPSGARLHLDPPGIILGLPRPVPGRTDRTPRKPPLFLI